MYVSYKEHCIGCGIIIVIGHGIFASIWLHELLNSRQTFSQITVFSQIVGISFWYYLITCFPSWEREENH